MVTLDKDTQRRGAKELEELRESYEVTQKTLSERVQNKAQEGTERRLRGNQNSKKR